MSEGSDDGRRAPPALDQFGMPIKGGEAPARRRVRRSSSTGGGGGESVGGSGGRSGTAALGEARPAERRRDGEPDTRQQEAVQQQVLFGVFAAMLVGITVLQKIGVPVGGTVIPVIVPITYAALLVGILFARPVFRPIRAILYLAVVVTSLLSTTLLATRYSYTSVALYFVLYLPLLVAFDATPETYRKCLRLFSNVMLAFAAVVWIQHAIQLSVGWQYWPDLDKLVPSSYLVPEFLYIQPIQPGMQLMKPSGISFLEVSFISQFLTLALILELLFLQRLLRAAFFGATLFATFAGTGLLLLLVSLPIIFTRLNIRTFITVLGSAFVALFVALQLNWFDLVANRLGEFDKQGTSASSRFIEPLGRVRRALLEPSALYSGIGAGQIEQGGNIFWWPLVKAVVEYGLFQGLLFYGFLFYSLFDRTPSRQLSIILILWYSFEGTLLTPLNPLGLVMLSSMFFLRDGVVPRRARNGAAAAAVPAVA